MGLVVVSHIAIAREQRASAGELAAALRSLVGEGLIATPATLLIGHVAGQSPAFFDPAEPPPGTTVAWQGLDVDDLIDALGHAWLTHDLMVLFHGWSPSTVADVAFGLVSLRYPREIPLFTASPPPPADARTWDESNPDEPEDAEDTLDDFPAGPTQTVERGMDGNELVYGDGAAGPFFDYVVIEGREAPRIADLDGTDLTDILSMSFHSRLTLCQSAW